MTRLLEKLGIQRLKAFGGDPLPWRGRLSVRGEVEATDAGDGLELLVGAPSVITPPALTDNVSAYHPAGFETASIVMLSATVPDVQIDGLGLEGIATVRRTFVNVGAHAIEFVGGASVLPESVRLPAGRSMLAVFDPAADDGAGAWVLQTGLEIDLAAELGADLLHWWEVPASSSPLITLNGSNVSQLDDRVASAHAVQATAGNQPAHHDSGGPGNQPYIELQDTARYLPATLAVAAGNRVGLYAVIDLPATNGLWPCSVNELGVTVRHRPLRSGGQLQLQTVFTGGLQTAAGTDPGGWFLVASRPLASGAVCQVNGVTVSSNFTGSDTIGAITSAVIGSSSGAGGGFALMLLVVNPTDEKDAIVRAYVAQRYGLSV